MDSRTSVLSKPPPRRPEILHDTNHPGQEHLLEETDEVDRARRKIRRPPPSRRSNAHCGTTRRLPDNRGLLLGAGRGAGVGDLWHITLEITIIAKIAWNFCNMRTLHHKIGMIVSISGRTSKVSFKRGKCSRGVRLHVFKDVGSCLSRSRRSELPSPIPSLSTCPVELLLSLPCHCRPLASCLRESKAEAANERR